MRDCDQIIKDVIGRIKKERNRQNRSQLNVANAADIAQSAYNGIEENNKVPNLRTLIKIALALKIEPWQLFIEEDQDREKAKEEAIQIIRNKL